MTLQLNNKKIHAAVLTGTPGGIYAWETPGCAAYLGIHATLEIVPDEPVSVEVEHVAMRMASALWAASQRVERARRR